MARLLRPTFRLLLVLASLPLASGGEAGPAYLVPPEPLRRVIEAPAPPLVRLAPDRARLLLLHRPGPPSIDELAGPELGLAGLRFNPDTRSPSREGVAERIEIVDIATGATRPVGGLPSAARIADVEFSPDGRRVALALVREASTELWGFELATALARRLTDRPLNRVLAPDLAWRPDGRGVIACFAPAGAGAAPSRPRAPAGPRVLDSDGSTPRPARTHPFLLADAHDDALFAHFIASDVLDVPWDGSAPVALAGGAIRRAESSPDGRWLLLEHVTAPFGRTVPAHAFGRRVEVVGLDDGRRVEVAVLPLAEDVPIGRDAARRGRRLSGWRSDAPASLWFVEALDEGDPARPAAARDALSLWAAPFERNPLVLARLAARLSSVQWGDDGLAVVTEDWWKTRERRVWRIAPGEPGAAPRLLFAHSSQDRYGDPGALQTVRNAAGRPVLLVDPTRRTLLLVGDGASEEGDRPFVDRLDPDTGIRARLFHSRPPLFERPLAVLDAAATRLLVSKESMHAPPDLFVVTTAGGAARALTAFPHPQPELLGVRRRELRFQRADGLPMSATLHLPPDHAEGAAPLPGLVWAYPIEFTSASDAGQVTTSPHRFVRVSPSSPVLFALAGYAVFDNASMPVVGAAGAEPNDTFVEQLGLNARAILAEGVRLGVLDPDRVAVAGHSYGAFMAANLLAHTDLFRAGLARSGAYNRSLTPFGFQREERTFWQAPEVYLAMSPFAHAHRIRAPLLLVHGAADDNSGTFPMQSERFFQALQGHARVSRLVVYPHESHGYAARESLLDLAARTLDWLETHVRPPAR